VGKNQVPLQVRRPSWLVVLGVALITASAVLYYAHYLIFRDSHHIFVYLIGDIAFLPIEVLIVTLILHRLLSARERRSRLEKMNMVIGAFQSEVGTRLLALVAAADPDIATVRSELVVGVRWTDAEYRKTERALVGRKYEVNIARVDLPALREFLLGKRDFLLRLLENPNLLEHESFTELLRAVFHVTEELEQRADLRTLPETDRAHLAGDIARAYSLLAREWLAYMKHLKDNYPYLFSLAIRTNPFDPAASPVVR
jgi:hypothetical protein